MLLSAAREEQRARLDGAAVERHVRHHEVPGGTLARPAVSSESARAISASPSAAASRPGRHRLRDAIHVAHDLVGRNGHEAQRAADDFGEHAARRPRRPGACRRPAHRARRRPRGAGSSPAPRRRTPPCNPASENSRRRSPSTPCRSCPTRDSPESPREVRRRALLRSRRIRAGEPARPPLSDRARCVPAGTPCRPCRNEIGRITPCAPTVA